MQGRARLGEFGLRLELTWNVSQYGPLEAKVLGEQGTDGPRIVFSK